MTDPKDNTRPVASTGDAAIRRVTAAVVVGVALIAAYVSYRHAYELARTHGEPATTAGAVPLTIDGLIFAASMVLLHAARHKVTPPRLAYALLGLAIAATLGANVAHGAGYGVVGALVAGWPAVALVGSYELLMWIVRSGPASQGQAAAPSLQPPVPDLAGVVRAASEGGMSQRKIADTYEISRSRVSALLAEASQNGQEVAG